MKIYCKNKNWKLNKEYVLDKILYLLIDRPTRINSWNDFVWKNNKGAWHRNYDLPAIITEFGYVSWRKNNISYRENNKSALIYK